MFFHLTGRQCVHEFYQSKTYALFRQKLAHESSLPRALFFFFLDPKMSLLSSVTMKWQIEAFGDMATPGISTLSTVLSRSENVILDDFSCPEPFRY